MEKKTKQATTIDFLARVIKESGKLQKTIGRTLSLGIWYENRRIPIHNREYNRDRLLREITELKDAVFQLESHLLKTYGDPINDPDFVDQENF